MAFHFTKKKNGSESKQRGLKVAVYRWQNYFELYLRVVFRIESNTDKNIVYNKAQTLIPIWRSRRNVCKTCHSLQLIPYLAMINNLTE